MTSSVSVASAPPRHRSLPDAVTTQAGREAVEVAALAGLYLDPWQAAVLESALSLDDRGKWAAMEVGLVVPRQNGKGSILEALELAHLFLFDTPLMLHSAHEFKTSSEAFRRIWSLIENTPDFERRVRRKYANNNDMSIELITGTRLRFVARSGGSGRGFSGDLVILDEAYNLSPFILSALVPTMSARPNPQLWYTSSAPLALPVSEPLRALCKRGRAGTSPRMAFWEWAAEADSDPADPATWAAANPGFGERVNEEFIRETEFSILPPEDFARERLGIWFDDEDAARIIPSDVWEACRDDRSGPTGQVAFALDVSPQRDWASFAGVGASGVGGTHLEVVDRRPGTGWVVGRAKELLERWGGQLAVSAGSPAASLLDELKVAGVSVVEVSNADHAVACGQIFDAITEGRVKHLGQPELDAAVAGADRKFTGDAWLWSRRLSLADISPLVAVTLAKWLHDQAEVPQPFILVG